MLRVVIKRTVFSDQGTFGRLTVYSGSTILLTLFTGELPWRDNKVGISCIPTGSYNCSPYRSRKYPKHYKVLDVPGREAILIHEGNFCGDTTKRFLSNVQGCILLGRALGTINNQQAVISSKLAMKDFRNVIGQNSFQLEIV